MTGRGRRARTGPGGGAGPQVSTGSILLRAVRPVVRESTPALLGMVVLILAAVALELAPPLLLRGIVDGHLKVGQAAGLWALAWLYLLATVGTRAVAFGQAYLTAVLGQRILLHLRLLVAGHLEALPLRYFDRTPVGDIMSRATADVEAVNTLFTSGVIGVVTDLFKIAGVAVAMFALSPLLGAMTLLSIPVVYFTAEFFRRNMRQAQRDMRSSIARINACLQETWSGAAILHVFGQAGRWLGRLGEQQTEYHKPADTAALYNAYFPGVLEALRALTTAAILFAAARPSLLDGGLTVGDLAAFALLIGRLFSPIQALSQEYQTIQQALAGVDRIVEVLREPPEDRGSRLRAAAEETPASPEGTPGAGRRGRQGRLVATGLGFGYEPGRPVLKGIDLIIEPGERVGLVGRTGAGKTSLLHLVAGVYGPTCGEIKIDGTSPISLAPQDRRRLLGVVPQAVQLFPGTLRDNITLGDAAVSEGRVAETLALVGLGGLIARLRGGLDTFIGPGGTSLSYGQSQMVCMARAVVCDPPLLLLDEPTSGVDSETEALLYRALQTAGKDRTMVLVSHRLSALHDVDRVVILANGRIVQDGAPGELAASGGWYKVFSDLEALGWRLTGSST